MRQAAAALLLMVAAVPSVASACSVRSGFRAQTALDLAAQADAIVVATVTGGKSAPSVLDSAVFARPTLLIKGSSLPAAVEIASAYLADDPRMRFTVQISDPRELRRVNAGAQTGGCVRYAFISGEQLLLFLRRDPSGELKPIRSAFARDAEDVAGPDALWVQAVREYARVAAAPRATWPDRLAVRAAELRRRGTADDLALAADMEIERGERRTR